MKQLKLWIGILFFGSMVLVGCKDDDDASPLSVSAISATGPDLETGQDVTLDLNGSTAATGVPVDVEITITFSASVDAATATSSNITLSDGTSDVSLSVAVSDNTVTLTPDEELEKGSDYTLAVSTAVQSTDGGAVSAAVTRTFQTGGRVVVTPPQEANQVLYLSFDGDLVDQTGNYTVGTNQVSGYESDRFGYVNAALSLNGNGDIVDIAESENLLSESITISFWMKVDAADTNKVNHNMGIMGAAAERGFFIEIGGAEGASWIKPVTSHMNSDDSYGTAWSDAINGAGTTNDVVTTAFEGNVDGLYDDKWVHFVLTYDATTSIKTVYIDDVIVRQEDFTNQDPNLLGIGFNDVGVESTISKNFAIGFYGSSDNAATSWAEYSTGPRTFSGLIDDVRIFSVALTSSEVGTLYEDEAP